MSCGHPAPTQLQPQACPLELPLASNAWPLGFLSLIPSKSIGPEGNGCANGSALRFRYKEEPEGIQSQWLRKRILGAPKQECRSGGIYDCRMHKLEERVNLHRSTNDLRFLKIKSYQSFQRTHRFLPKGK